MSPRVLPVVAVAVLAALVPACNKGGGSSAGGGQPRVAIVTNCTAEFWSICEAGAKKAAKENNVDLDFRQPKTLSVSDQRELVDAVTKRGVAGIAVSVIDPQEQTQYLKRLAEKTSLLTMDNDAPDSGRLGYVGIDNYEAGKAVGRLVKAALPNGGTVALFIGGTTSANAKARVGGVLDELAGQKGATGPKYGKFTLYNGEPVTDGTDEAKARQNANAVLEKLKDTPDVCLIGLYAYNPKHLLLAYRSKKADVKHPVKIAAFDEDDTTLDGVSSGDILGTVVQDPFQYGYKSVEILAALARGDKSKAKDEPIPYRVLTRDGGPTTTVNGIAVQNLKASEFKTHLAELVASAK